MKDKIRKLTKRNRGRSFYQIISELTPVLRGWLLYFQHASSQYLLRNLDSWIRRKLRCYRIKQCKRKFTLHKFLVSLGVEKWQSWILALSGKSLWRLSGCPQVHQAMGTQWFDTQGLYNLSLNYARLNNLRKPPSTRVRSVV
ncbi:MAG: group II intron maturase-specific domain-containing protein [Bacteroidales bacterium]